MKLEELRAEIDGLDDQIAGLLRRRLELVDKVAEAKRESRAPVLHAGREREILDRLGKDDPDGTIRSVYRYLFEISRARQNVRLSRRLETACTRYPHKVRQGSGVVAACPGTFGAFSAQALSRMLPDAEIRFCPSFRQAVQSVAEGQSDYCAVPTHNSYAGSVLEVFDLLTEFPVYMVDSVRLPITHNLLGLPGAKIGEIRKVFSHPQALAQCQGFLARRLPQAEAVPMENTALAAEFVAASGEHRFAALASAECAEHFRLEALEADAQDSNSNYTGFALLAPLPNQCPDNRRISIVAGLPHTAGSLYALLTKFYVNDLNLTKIESRPLRDRDFEYLFYLDFEGNLADAKISALLGALAEELPYFKFLGNY